MKIIGITGSSGAGKSIICDILQKQCQVKIINADLIAKRLSKQGTSYISEIVKTFGRDILDEQGELRRNKLAEIIYTSPEKRKELNSCTFKYIRKEIEREINKEKDGAVIVIDAPLLFESELNKICDYVIGVISQKDLQIQRIIKRDHINYEQAQKRLFAQESNEFYISKCDEIIENNNDIGYIEECIQKVVMKYNITKRLQ